jgi:uncharacterized protein YdbL (DUF1318 family)
MTRTRFLSFLTALTLVAMPAFAMDLTEAKSAGLVGEQTNGLIAPIGDVDADVQALVGSVNAGRMKIYTQNAKDQGVPVDQVQAIAGEKLQAVTPKGQFVQNADGEWVRK